MTSSSKPASTLIRMNAIGIYFLCSLLSTCSTWPNAITFATRDRAVTKLIRAIAEPRVNQKLCFLFSFTQRKFRVCKRDITLLTEPPPFVIFPKFESAAENKRGLAICSESVLQLLLVEYEFQLQLVSASSNIGLLCPANIILFPRRFHNH